MRKKFSEPRCDLKGSGGVGTPQLTLEQRNGSHGPGRTPADVCPTDTQPCFSLFPEGSGDAVPSGTGPPNPPPSPTPFCLNN